MTWKQEIYYRVLEMADNSCIFVPQYTIVRAIVLKKII